MQNLFKLRIPDGSAALIRGMHPLIKKKIKESLRLMLSEPYTGIILREEPMGLRSFRIGRLRIIYKIAGKEIQLAAIGPRKTIYTETFKMIKRGK